MHQPPDTDIKQTLPHILEQHRLWLRGSGGLRADLTGADLRGADLIDAGQRSDGYEFYANVGGGKLMIKAGCRYLDIDAAREHWRATRGGTPLGDETMAILDYIERVAAIRGMWVRGSAP